MHRVATAFGVVVGLAVALGVAGCSQIQGVLATPFLGSVEDCSPNLDAGLCRRIGEVAIRSVAGPAVAAESVRVSQWDSCANEDLTGFAPGAAQGTVCYSVMGSGYAGGERIAPNTYRNGTPVDIEAAVWSDNNGELHAAARATPVEMVPQP